MKFCPYTLLRLCQECGFEFRRIGNRLQVTSIAALTPEMRDALRRHKAELLAILPEGEP